MAYLAVGIGSALGGMGRFWIAGLIGQRFGDAFPWGTILVNISGSFVIGLLGALASSEGRLHPKLSPLAAQFFMVGTLKLIQAGSVSQAGANIALSVVACLIAVWAGYLVGQVFNR